MPPSTATNLKLVIFCSPPAHALPRLHTPKLALGPVTSCRCITKQFLGLACLTGSFCGPLVVLVPEGICNPAATFGVVILVPSRAHAGSGPSSRQGHHDRAAGQAAGAKGRDVSTYVLRREVHRGIAPSGAGHRVLSCPGRVVRTRLKSRDSIWCGASHVQGHGLVLLAGTGVGGWASAGSREQVRELHFAVP